MSSAVELKGGDEKKKKKMLKMLPRLSRVQSGNANYTQFIYGLTYATLTPTAGWLLYSSSSST